jgi:hypothetical protein
MYTCGECLKSQGCINFYIRRDTETDPPGANPKQECMFGHTANWMGITVDSEDAPEIFRRILFGLGGGDISLFDKKPIEVTDRFSDLGE